MKGKKHDTFFLKINYPFYEKYDFISLEELLQDC